MINDKNTKENINTLNDSDYLNFLTSLRDYYGTYHHHKENMAWVAFVVYLGTIITLFTTVVIQYEALNEILGDYYLKIIFIIIVIVIEILLAIFVIWEFWYRRIAAYLVAAYLTSISKFLSGKITQKDFKNQEKLTFCFNLICLKIHEHKTNYFVPEFIAKEYKNISKNGKLLLNEKISYSIMAASLFCLVTIMIKNLLF